VVKAEEEEAAAVVVVGVANSQSVAELPENAGICGGVNGDSVASGVMILEGPEVVACFLSVELL